MLPADALKHLGVTRVIWIDDVFVPKVPQLAELLFNSHDVAAACNFPELHKALAQVPYEDGSFIEEISRILAGLSDERREAIRAEFFSQETIAEKFATPEVTREDIDSICAALGIDGKDKWTFGQADKEVEAIIGGGDENVAFIVDLNEAGGGDARGLEIIKLLYSKKSKSTAFILTHAATADSEAAKEEELRRSVAGDNSVMFMPICVIAKKRLEDTKTKEQLDHELLVSIKRASLRKSMAQVVAAAGPEISAAFQNTASGLLSVPPEQLEEYVYEKGYTEGVSELHVVERIVTSQISQRLQAFFGKDPQAQGSASRLRKLRGIKLGPANGQLDERLLKYRLDEVWEGSDLINSSYSPISCGDVFVVDRHENDVKKVEAMFVLLAQPCDIALRPVKMFRAKETAVLVPLVELKTGDDSDGPGVIPCDLQKKKWRCNFDRATVVSVPILDLASFRTDGRVRLDEEQVRPVDLVPSHDRIYNARVKIPGQTISGEIVHDGQGVAQHPSLQLTFGYDYEFSHFYAGRVKDAKGANTGASIPALPKRITWRLQRMGRIRPPYSIGFLEDYLRDMGRRAFDRDFTTSTLPEITAVEAAVEAKDAKRASLPVAAVTEADAVHERPDGAVGTQDGKL